MRIHEVTPYPEKGQWWAHKVPLLLYQVEWPGDLITFKEWHPLEGIRDASFVGPLNSDEWAYLWFSGEIGLNLLKELEPVRVGDAYMVGPDQIFFVGGVNRLNATVVVLSDNPVVFGRDKITKLLAGPVDPADEPLSAYERILSNESIPEG